MLIFSFLQLHFALIVTLLTVYSYAFLLIFTKVDQASYAMMTLS